MDQKNRDKKITVKASACYFFAGACFLLSSVICLMLEENKTTGIIFLGLGSLYLGLGTDYRSRDKNGQSEDRKK